MKTPLRLTRHLLPMALLAVLPFQVALAKGDLELKAENLTLSDPTVTHQQTIKIYATVNNNSSYDLLGSVQFRNKTTDNAIGSDQPISVLANATDSVFVEWAPHAGTYTITATVIPWDTTGDNPENNRAEFTVTVDYDFDGDGVGNAQDPDDDGDAVPDAEDAFPLDDTESLDTNGNGIGNNADPDDDGDNVPDTEDAFPLDDTEWLDTDGNGIGNNADEDDDGDGLTDEEEITGQRTLNGTKVTLPPTNPQNADTDMDGADDGKDAFPINPTEWVDTDGDNIGNNADEDDENDGLPDNDDEFPLNKGPVIVLNVYEEENTENSEALENAEAVGVRMRFWDASLSYDPEGGPIAYRWFTKDGRLIGEEAILKLRIGLDSFLPASLIIIDQEGEQRIFNLSNNAKKTLGALGLALLFCLLIALALMIYLKYTSTASKEHPSKKFPSSSKKSRKS